MRTSLTKHNLCLANIPEASACEESIRLSANEWKKARHFDDKFWLYVVTGATGDAPTAPHPQPGGAFSDG
jgi:hypothetical protein